MSIKHNTSDNFNSNTKNKDKSTPTPSDAVPQKEVREAISFLMRVLNTWNGSGFNYPMEVKCNELIQDYFVFSSCPFNYLKDDKIRWNRTSRHKNIDILLTPYNVNITKINSRLLDKNSGFINPKVKIWDFEIKSNADQHGKPLYFMWCQKINITDDIFNQFQENESLLNTLNNILDDIYMD